MTGDGVCRACLKSLIAASEDLRLFVDMDAYVFTYCTSLQLSEDDALTKSICRGCHDLLNSFYAFKQLCISSNETLLERLDSKAKLRRTADVRLPVEPKEELKQEEDDFDDCAFDDDCRPDDDSDEEWKPKIALPLKFLTENGQKLEGQEVDPVTLQPIKKKHAGGRPRKRERKIVMKERGKRIHSCTTCAKKYALLQSLEEHVLVAHQGLTRKSANKCTECNKCFSTRNHLTRHYNSTHNVSKLTCECGLVLESFKALRSHQKTHRLQNERVCPICGKSISEEKLSYHLYSHRYKKKEPDIDVQCDTCGKHFTRRSRLKYHLSYAHVDRKFTCDVCDGKFFTKHSLDKHMKTHLGLKEKCKICGKRYARKAYLEIHMRAHTGERPFECDLCPMTFSNKVRQVEHRRVHTGEKPFECHICNHCFSQYGTYQRHLRQVHNRDPKEVTRQKRLALENKINLG